MVRVKQGPCPRWSVTAIDTRYSVRRLKEIVEVFFRAHATADPENVGRCMPRVKRDKIARPLPQKAGSGKQVMNLKGALLGQAQGCQIESQPARLSMVRIHIGDDEN